MTTTHSGVDSTRSFAEQVWAASEEGGAKNSSGSGSGAASGSGSNGSAKEKKSKGSSKGGRRHKK